MNSLYRKPLYILLSGLLVSVLACDRRADESANSERRQSSKAAPEKSNEPGGRERREKLTEIDAEIRRSIVRHYTTLAHAAYTDSLERTERLAETAEYLGEKPSPDALKAARQAWLEARKPFARATVFAYEGSPIHREGRHARLDSWPVDGAYVDSLPQREETGFVNNPDKRLSDDSIAELTKNDGSGRVAAGYNAIEFVLWGAETEKGRAGRRHTDFKTGSGATAPNADRRTRYLRVAVELLLHDLAALVEAWSPEADANYHGELTSMEHRESIARIFAGLDYATGDYLIERQLRGPLQGNTPRDISSPYSDSTRAELLQVARSIAHTYRGVYQRTDNSSVEGPGVGEIVATLLPDLDEKLREQFDSSIDAIGEIPTPLDEAMTGEQGRAAVEKAIERLEAQRATLRRIGEILGLDLDVE